MLLPLALLAAAVSAQPVDGLWHATVLNPSGDPVAFQLELTHGSQGLRGTLRNGPDRNESTSATFDGIKLRIEFDYWDAILDATLAHGKLAGAITRTWRKTRLTRTFAAQREPLPAPKARPAANLRGEWLLRTEDPEGKKDIYQAVLSQHGSRVSGTLLHVTGDSGALTGTMDGNQLTLSRFDGIRATLLKLTVNPDGTLAGMMDSKNRATAHRITPKDASAFDPGAFTRVREPAKPLQFAFPDLDGNSVSLADTRFQGKVVLVTIMGSWCPNCHDETPLLNELYERYRHQGFEVVALGFEYTGDAPRDIRQLKVFAAKFGVKYPILYAGATEDAARTLDQLENFGAYPTTLLIGRDGLVRRIHAGFDGPATGERFHHLKRELAETIEQALAQQPAKSVTP